MMATESPVRMVESGGPTKWPPAKGVALFASRLHNMASDELEVLLKAQKFREDPRNMVPNRSGSAPPSMEGSHATYGDLMGPQSSNVKSSMINLRSSAGTCKSEEILCTDPTNIAFHYSNLNLNPRLPRPRVSRENKGQCSITGCLGNDSRLTSFDDSGNGSLHFAGNSLSTHKEEPEDDKPDDSSESGNVVIPEYDESPLAARHKSLVDLIQEDFPRTPSPLYNLSHSSSHATADECIDHDIQAISLDDFSYSASKLSDSISGSANTCVDMSTEGRRTYGITSNENPLPNNLLKGSNRVTIAESRSPQDVQLINKHFGPGDKVIQSGGTRSDVFSQQQSNGKHLQLQQHMTFPQLCFTYPVHGVQSQVMISEGLSPSQHSMEESHSKISPEVQQQFLQPHGLTPPLYATAAGFMTTSGNPFYPGSPHFSGLYPPNYGVSGGYSLNSPFCPPFVAGYPSHLTGDLQHLNKFFRGQQGLMPSQPSLSEPALQMQMQFFQQSREDPFGGQYGWLAPVDALRGQVGSFSSEKQATGTAAAYRVDQKLQPIANGNPSIPNPRRAGELAASGYYVSPPMTQYWASPVGSPLMPSSPAAGSNIPGRRNELQFSQGSSTNLGIYTGWQGQRGVDSLSGHKKYSILDELKSSSGRKIDLSDIAGRIVEFSVDQHGSRFIQQKLENCGVEEKESVFREVLPHVSKLMTDVFGNYVIQKFFEYGSREQRKQLADQLSGKILPLTLQMYGCRVIQKALEVIELDQKTELMLELDGHVMRCVRDQNGNHVIQKCIESIPMEKIGFIISSFQGHVATLSTHPYGCRVIQRVLEHCGDELQSQCIVDEILESAYILAQDQYGNYVTQHVLERGKPHERSQIISKLTGRIVQMSQHKYASNVVEKCLEHGDAVERERLVEEILGQSDENNNLLTMMKDQFANYVVQKILETSNDKQREVLLNRIRINLQALKKYTYGKHIVARFDQLCSEEAEASES